MSVNPVHICLVHLIGFFLFSGAAKLVSMTSFLSFVDNFNVLSSRLTLVFGSMIPFLEISGAVLLLHSQTRLYGLTLLMFLLICFAYGILRVLKEDRTIRCGCYGKWINASADTWTLGKNIYLFTLLLILFLAGSQVTLEKITVFSTFTGAFMTFLTIAAHKSWQIHQDTIRRLRKPI
ncbi:Methylamine utilisation protein MauE [Evansella caseinilytica]|uniref:Methylamine utilisation protein MauE n=1 Tax=Evansella caseinilytica TaxID=1503961 RepID=A0A1H3IV88_9BACI|nr:MauE/DoxX family redox-associated membrane protein [Evansella caseinilytica]SDY31582.1 Methylamine utilisation protein MauE [Evansella caseinilytica]